MELLDFKRLVESFSINEIKANCEIVPNLEVIVNIQVFDQNGYISKYQRREYFPEQIQVMAPIDAMYLVKHIVEKIKNQG